MNHWNTYNSSKFQVENFFRSNKLSQFQIDELVKILNVLAKYMLIDRNILNVRAGQKIGLSHLQRAINLDLIIELKDFKALNSKTEVEDHHYFYTLGFAGINFLGLSNKEFYYFNIADTFNDKQKVLMFNYEAHNKNYRLLFSFYNDMKYYNFFHCKNDLNKDIILYFEKYISINRIEVIMKKKFISRITEEQFKIKDDLFDKFISQFDFETIEFTATSFNSDLKVDYGSYNNKISAEKRFNATSF
ncbi:hypothetical protein AALA13_17795 [Lachnospiraceae bacterium 50-23]|jgi:septum formation topological specificity factor MinE